MILLQSKHGNYRCKWDFERYIEWLMCTVVCDFKQLHVQFKTWETLWETAGFQTFFAMYLIRPKSCTEFFKQFQYSSKSHIYERFSIDSTKSEQLYLNPFRTAVPSEGTCNICSIKAWLIRVFHKLSTIQECQYCQICFSSAIRKELDQWNL